MKYRLLVLAIVGIFAVGGMALSAIALMGSGTSNLPTTCKSWHTFSVSAECHNDIDALARAGQAKCYDNYDYVPCLGLAKEADKFRLGLEVFALLGLIDMAVLYLVILRPNSKA